MPLSKHLFMLSYREYAGFRTIEISRTHFMTKQPLQVIEAWAKATILYISQMTFPKAFYRTKYSLTFECLLKFLHKGPMNARNKLIDKWVYMYKCTGIAQACKNNIDLMYVRVSVILYLRSVMFRPYRFIKSYLLCTVYGNITYWVRSVDVSPPIYNPWNIH